jgi:nucleotide-binding universal stress UspA family protein
MAFEAILVQTNIDDFAEDRIKLAADLAQRSGAILIGDCSCAIQPILVDAVAVGVPGLVEDPSDIEAQLQTAQARFRGLVEGTVKTIEWRSALNFPTEHAALQARAADLVVTGPRRGSSFYREVNPADLVMLAGRPVLVVPSNVSRLAADRIVVAWKDTREARRALLDSLWFLERATEVTVAAVAKSSDSDAVHSTNDVVSYLRHHKVNANCLNVNAEGAVAATIGGLARDLGADLIVAGAYGHSRLREWIFGGVTRDLLTKSPICCLMSN